MGAKEIFVVADPKVEGLFDQGAHRCRPCGFVVEVERKLAQTYSL